MFLQYRTGVATLVQFVTLSLLGVINGLDSIVTTCGVHGRDCASNAIVSIIFFILTCLWFGAIWLLGAAAQENRSQRLAYVLITIEAGVVMVAAFNGKHRTNLLSLVTSLIDIALALWVMMLAWRLSRARGGRIVASERVRQRRNKPIL